MKFEDYKVKQSDYREFAETVRFILDKAITGTPGVPRPQSIQARAKDPDSLKKKLEKRGIINSGSIEEEIKDLAGVRPIFYTNAHADVFLNSGILSENFVIHREKTRHHYPTADNPNQKYQAIHITVSLKPERSSLPEYAKFKDMQCEVQIQTALNHVWAEIHHVLYKRPEVIGFGSRALASIEKRMHRVMDEYLLPAGHELQKAQYDYERLMEGLPLFDRGPLESLSQSQDNNERYDVLSTIREHVLPNYDDIDGIYPDLCRALVAAVEQSKQTEIKPIETTFGTLRGKTSKDIIKIVAGLIEDYRYINIAETFDCLVSLYKAAEDEEDRQLLLKVGENLADYNLNVLKQIGYHTQTKLVEKIKNFSPEEQSVLQPLISRILGELLHSEVSGSSWSFDKVVISRGAVQSNDELRTIRSTALNTLFGMLDSAPSESDKRRILSAINSATRLPMNYTEEICTLVLENTKEIVEKLTDRIADIPFQLLEHIEHHFWLQYRRTRGIAQTKQDWNKAKVMAEETTKAILKFRDAINDNEAYVKYKTLVGFEGVFPEHWEDDDYNAETHRQKCAKQFASEINEENKDQWYDFIKTCTATESNDGATFPVFGEFLYALALTKPDIAIDYIKRADNRVLDFLPRLLAGIAQSGHQQYNELVSYLISEGKQLGAITMHFQLIDNLPLNLLRELVNKTISIKDNHAAIQLVSLAIAKHKQGNRTLIDELFIPMIKYLNQHQDARWIRVTWYKESSAFFKELTYDEARLVTQNLITFPEINYQSEGTLVPIAEKYPELVWNLFSERLQRERENPDDRARYDALPHEFYRLHTVLSKDVAAAIKAIRAWYRPNDALFEFTGGSLLRAVFPNLEESFAAKLIELVKTGSKEDIGFVLGVLKNYRGVQSIHPVIKAIIEQIPENDPMINGVEICLASTGVVSGEFGMVEAYAEKREAIKVWLTDENPKIKKFAEGYIESLTQMMASEQRRAEQRNEARKRDFDGDEEGS